MRKLVIGDLRVQEVVFPSGRVAYTILHPDGEADRLAEGFLRTCNGGTDRAYATCWWITCGGWSSKACHRRL